MSNKSLEQLSISNGEFQNSAGQVITDPKPVGYPVIVSVYSNSTLELEVPKNAPDLANAYTVGNPIGAPVLRGPRWNYVPVQFYKTL